jgi:hypothetical protein
VDDGKSSTPLGTIAKLRFSWWKGAAAFADFDWVHVASAQD